MDVDVSKVDKIRQRIYEGLASACRKIIIDK